MALLIGSPFHRSPPGPSEQRNIWILEGDRKPVIGQPEVTGCDTNRSGRLGRVRLDDVVLGAIENLKVTHKSK
jgi:hypothetical protein